MCGIAGIVDSTGSASRAMAERMTDALRHRGPDGSGAWTDGFCALGHRRLAIIDLSEGGRQPLSNEDNTVHITFNGEIYNFQDLRRQLEGLGHTFRSHTDTEAIVHAYEQWGTGCVERLRGMFAFGIWDQQRRRLFLARDRVGKKPLFYAQAGDQFLFASELQGLLASGSIPRTPDLQALDSYLSWGYVPAPATGFTGVYKLPPAHWLTLEVEDEDFKTDIQRYWRLDYGPKLTLSENEAAEALREKLTEAVRLRMISDVPLGAFLSGGIDSSIVVGVMAGLSERPVKTFSIGFEEAGFNELDHARRIAEKWSTEHHEHIVRADALAILPLLVRHYGEPYADSSAIPTFYVSQLTRQNVTVALNGDGGDESFCGYERYLGSQIGERIRNLPGSHLAARALARVLPDSTDSKSRLRQARRFLSAVHRPMVERYAGWVGFFQPEGKRRLYTAEFQALVDPDRSLEWMGALFRESGELDPAERAMCADVQSYLPYDLLVKVDITSMAHGLEARSPFLDHELMEFAARLPVNLKLRGRNAKWMLKKSFPDLLPRANVQRRKMGFGVPVGEWFRGPLRELLCDSLLSERSLQRGCFRPEEVHRLVQEHLDREADHTYGLWSLLMLELWRREMVDAPAVA